MRSARGLAVPLALALASAPSPSAPAMHGLAIVGATLIDGTGAPALGDSVVVVGGERIRAVGPRALVPIPKGVQVIDGRGKWVVPGLVDAHVHFFQSGGAYTRPDVIDLRKHRPYEREIATLIKIWFIHRPGDDLAAGRAIVAATVAESRAHGLRVAVHATELEAARVAVEEGAAVLVHSVMDLPVDEAFVSLLEDKRVIYTPTLFVSEGYRLALSGAWAPTPAERRLGDPEVMATLEELKHLPELSSAPGRGGDALRVASENLRRLSAARVTIAVGTDAGNIGTLHGPSFFREVALMAQAGMSAREVLVAATRGGAAVMGRDRDLGTLEAGKLADLLLLEADPLADPANLERLRRVVKGGRVFTPDELQRIADGRD